MSEDETADLVSIVKYQSGDYGTAAVAGIILSLARYAAAGLILLLQQPGSASSALARRPLRPLRPVPDSLRSAKAIQRFNVVTESPKTFQLHRGASPMRARSITSWPNSAP